MPVKKGPIIYFAIPSNDVNTINRYITIVHDRNEKSKKRRMEKKGVKYYIEESPLLLHNYEQDDLEKKYNKLKKKYKKLKKEVETDEG